MSIIQYQGAQAVSFSSNIGQVAGAQSARGSLVSLIFSGSTTGGAVIFDSNASTNAGKIVGIATTNFPYAPAVPSFYRNGLFMNASGNVNVVVSFIPHGAG